MFRSVILAASRSPRVERLVSTAPRARGVASRFVAGQTVTNAIAAARSLIADGLAVTVAWLGRDSVSQESAMAARDEYLGLIEGLSREGLTPAAEISVSLAALGHAFDSEGALARTRTICEQASEAGTTITLDAEGDPTTDGALDLLAAVRRDFPTTGVTVTSRLRRSVTDCAELAAAGSRVRLCKGQRREPESVAFQSRLEIDRSYVRCLNALMSGDGYPMVATHDPRLIAIAEDRAKWFDRGCDEFEFQMLYGVRSVEQRRLARHGYTTRIYVPYGEGWYQYLVQRIAERPANAGLAITRPGSSAQNPPDFT